MSDIDGINYDSYLAREASKAGLGNSHLTRPDKLAVEAATENVFQKSHWITQNNDGTTALSRNYPVDPPEVIPQ